MIERVKKVAKQREISGKKNGRVMIGELGYRLLRKGAVSGGGNLGTLNVV